VQKVTLRKASDFNRLKMPAKRNWLKNNDSQLVLFRYGARKAALFTVRTFCQEFADANVDFAAIFETAPAVIERRSVKSGKFWGPRARCGGAPAQPNAE
jgi:hypothetical protein